MISKFKRQVWYKFVFEIKGDLGIYWCDIDCNLMAQQLMVESGWHTVAAGSVFSSLSGIVRLMTLEIDPRRYWARIKKTKIPISAVFVYPVTYSDVTIMSHQWVLSETVFPVFKLSPRALCFSFTWLSSRYCVSYLSYLRLDISSWRVEAALD